MLCFNSLVLDEPLNCGLQNFAPKIRNITIVWCTTFRHIKPFRHNSTMLETDRQMNRNATAIACIWQCTLKMWNVFVVTKLKMGDSRSRTSVHLQATYCRLHRGEDHCIVSNLLHESMAETAVYDRSSLSFLPHSLTYETYHVTWQSSCSVGWEQQLLNWYIKHHFKSKETLLHSTISTAKNCTRLSWKPYSARFL